MTTTTVGAPKTRTEEIALLVKRIEESGLSVTAFAEEVLIRESRTIRRWLSGDNPIPKMVIEFLVAPRKAQWP